MLARVSWWVKSVKGPKARCRVCGEELGRSGDSWVHQRHRHYDHRVYAEVLQEEETRQLTPDEVQKLGEKRGKHA